MKRRKGFTLVELLVAISVLAILAALLTGTALFIKRANETTTNTTSATYSLRKIKDYIIENDINDSSTLDYRDQNLYHNDSVIFVDLIFSDLDFRFYDDEHSYRCEIDYEVDDKLDYIKFVVKMKE